ncbi:uncharacterized protein [Apostichopus japonicus]|uniref:uncharacterized protein isoform X2 n=1 Tax=Stichopus japonicus TaxID=307972 RepID=UPI003AB6F622
MMAKLCPAVSRLVSALAICMLQFDGVNAQGSACTFTCPPGIQVCGSNGVTYPNICELARAICLGVSVVFDADGPCQEVFNQGIAPCSTSQQLQCGNEYLVRFGQPCFSTSGGDFVCNCGVSEDGFFQIGRQCSTPIAPQISVTSLQTCYGCSQNFFTSINYPNNYEDRRGDVYLLFIPGALEIQFSFDGIFDVEELKDDLFVGAGLEFDNTDIEIRTLGPSGSGGNLVYFFDNRLRNQAQPSRPDPFSIPGDSAWIYFNTDRNIVGSGFRLTWQAQVDNDPPIISCPGTQTRDAILGSLGTVVVFSEPTAFDAIGTASLVTSSASSGDFFLVGSTEVTYIFRDDSGNMATCSFNIVVVEVDDVLPVIACVGLDVTETIPLNGFGTTVQFREPTATDNSGTVNLQSRTHTPGQFFQSGTTQVTYVFIDPSGNTAECSFNIIIIEVDDVLPVIACVGLDVTETIPLNGFGTTVQFREPTATDNSGTVNLQSRTHTPGQFFQSGTTQVTYVFIDPSGNTAECSFNIIIIEVDDVLPVIACVGLDVTETIPLNGFGTTVQFREPTATDNSGTVNLQSRTHTPGQFFQSGTTQVTYVFIDPSGNTAECSFNIIIIEVDDVLPVIACVGLDVTETIPLNGFGTTVQFREPTATDNSGTVNLQSRTHTPGQFFQSGTTQVTYVFIDPSGNTAECSFNIIIIEVDDVLPVIACVGLDVTETIPLNGFGTTVQFREPTATDNSGTVNLQSRTHTPGQFFQSGTTQVTYVFIDPSGNTAECSFNIIIIEVDDTPPDVTCIQDITRIVTIDSTGTTVFWTEPTATDNSGVVSLQSRSHAPGEFFSPGTTQVTYIFADPSGNTAPCTFTVIVIRVDNTPPVINCPGDQTANTDISNSGVVVFFTEPTALDNSGTAFLVSQTAEPGDFFTVGTTPVTYIYRDPSNNQQSCTFNIEVIRVDNTPPVINCPGDQTANTDISNSGVVVFFTEPTALDNSGTAFLVSQTAEPGDFFTVGTTPVTYIYRDPSNNQQSCTFNIEVIRVDNTPPVINCPGDQTANTDISNSGVVVFFTEPTALDNSGTAFLVSQTAEPGDFFTVGTTPVTYIYRDPSNNQQSCTFNIEVIRVDNTPPVINCPGDQTANTDISNSGVVVFFTEPTALDNSGTAFLVSQTAEPGDFFTVGTRPVTYIYRDPSNNQQSCTFNIEVIRVDNTPPVINCPGDQTANTDISNSGVVVFFTEPTALDNSGTAFLVSQTAEPGDFFTVGTRPVTYIYRDPSNNQQSCTFNIEVIRVDNTPPVINCPGDQTANTDISNSGVVVFFTEPTALDNSGTAFLVSRTAEPGDFFTVGPRPVTYTFRDPSNNQQSCTFNIEVIRVDNTPPVINCPGDQTANTDISNSGVVVFFTEPTALDNSGTAFLVSQTAEPGDFFTVGTTPVTYIYRDPSNNQQSCTFNIEVIRVDNTPPVINCPGDQTANTDISNSGVVVFFTEPTALDNSGTAFLVSQTAEPGDFFTVGTTPVTYIYRDPSNNQQSCTFNIEVIRVDNTPPVINCPGDQTANTDISNSGVVVFFTEPTALDNSGTAFLVSQTAEPGDFFTVGTTPVTYIYRDPSNNQQSCTFNIEVIRVDNTPPVINCPGDQTANTDISNSGVVVFFTEPTALDNSGTAFLVSQTAEPGDFFTVGTTPVTYIYRDPSNNQQSCTFNIEVIRVDNTPPVINCPGDQTANTDISNSGVVVFFTEPTALDNSGTAFLVSQTAEPGDFFTVGTTPVTYIYRDPSNNQQSCTFNIEVIRVDNTPPVINCPGDQTANTDISNSGVVVFFTEPTATDNSGTVFLVSRTGEPGDFFTVGTTPVTYTYRDPSNNQQSCTFNIEVIRVDNTPPVINCPGDQTANTDISNSGVVVFFTEPTATDNSGTAFLVSRTAEPGDFFTVGTRPVTYTFRDPSNNQQSCTFNIEVIRVDNTPPVINCPGDQTANTDISNSGVVVFFTEPTATDNSGTVFLVSRTAEPGDFFTVGTRPVTYTYRDPSNNQQSCTFNIEVIRVDNDPPFIVNCPDPIQASLNLGASVSVTWPTILAFDNSGDPVTEDCSHQSGQLFQFGQTVVTCTYRDPTGNRSPPCIFSILVTVGPIVQCCPNDITQEIPFGQTGANVQYPLQCNLDQNPDVQIISRSRQSGERFPVGETVVTITLQDTDNFQASCSFTIDIVPVDRIPPVINCPGLFVQETTVTTGTVVNFPEPTATDNSGSVSLVSRVPVPGSVFTVGDTLVTYIFQDPSRNPATCRFIVSVIVVDTDPPMLLCPGDIVIAVLIGVRSERVDWPFPIVSDPSQPVTLVRASHNPGEEFLVGTTTVEYAYSDARSNTGTCSFDVTIIEENPCSLDLCRNGGTCVTIEIDVTGCICPRCFTGEFCQIPVDACTGNMCSFGSTCLAVPGSCQQYTCQCSECFTGPFCNIAGDVCAWSDCQNGGICQPDLFDCTRYTCQCPTCFSGEFCQIRANGCSPINPCANGGVCTDLSNIECGAFRCDCVGCFSGFACGTAIPNPCNQQPCRNGGTCTRNIQFCASYTCRCLPGFSGDDCQSGSVVLVNPCNSFPCRNGATCVSEDSSDLDYTCVCPSGFSGINCNMIVVPGADLCLGNPCRNRGTCFVSYHSGSTSVFYTPQYICLCANGFTGTDCQLLVSSFPSQNICATTAIGSCQNGGSCVNTYNSFSREESYICECLGLANGQNCQIFVTDACLSSPCLNSGTCVSQNGGFRCICNPAFQGTFCQIIGFDNQPPVIINCPDDTSRDGPSPIFFTPPQATDNSGYVRLVFMSHRPGDLFTAGTTIVSYVFADAANNQNQCSFVVSIENNGLPPFIRISNCPGDIVVRTNTASANVMFGTPTGSSSEGDVFLASQSHRSGNSFSLGSTAVVYNFVDTSGNRATCSFEVTVINSDNCERVCSQQFVPVCGSDRITYYNLCTFEEARCRNPILTYVSGVCEQDPCSPNPCQAGGACVLNPFGTVLCLCTQGRTGSRCESVIPLCSPNPCLNGGTCIDLVQEFFCRCPADTSGNICEIDNCDRACTLQFEPVCGSDRMTYSNLCTFQEAQCRNPILTYVSGACQQDPCSPNPCQAGGTCVRNNGDFLCLCTQGRTGSRCENGQGLVIDGANCQDRFVFLDSPVRFQEVIIVIPTATFNGIVVPPNDFGGIATSLSRTMYFLDEGQHQFIFRYELAGNTATCDFTITVGDLPLARGERSVGEATIDDLTICDPNPCMNGGQCRPVYELHSLITECECPDGWSGDVCTTPVTDSLIYDQVTMFTVLLLLVVVMVMVMYQTRQHWRKQSLDEKPIIQ